MIPMPWSSIVYWLTSIEKGEWEGSVSNVEKRDSLTTVLNTMKITAPAVIECNRGNINNKDQDICLPLKLLPNTQKPKELTLLSHKYKR